MAGVFSSTLKGLHYLGFMSRVHREMVAGIRLFGGEGHAKPADLESGWTINDDFGFWILQK